MVDGRGRARAAGVAACAVAARKPVQSGEPGAPTDADVLAAATGEDAGDGVPAAPHATAGVGAADGRRASSGCRRSPSPTSSREIVWPPDRSTSGSSRASAGPARRSPPTATPSTSPHALAPDLVVLVADAGLGTINAVRLVGRRARRAPRSSSRSTASAPTRCTNATSRVLRADGLTVVTTPAALAALLLTPTQ